MFLSSSSSSCSFLKCAKAPLEQSLSVGPSVTQTFDDPTGAAHWPTLLCSLRSVIKKCVIQNNIWVYLTATAAGSGPRKVGNLFQSEAFSHRSVTKRFRVHLNDDVVSDPIA